MSSGRVTVFPSVEKASQLGRMKEKHSWCLVVVRVTALLSVDEEGWIVVGVSRMPYWHHRSKTRGSQLEYAFDFRKEASAAAREGQRSRRKVERLLGSGSPLGLEANSWITGSSIMRVVRRRGCMRARLVSMFAPKEWPMPIIGRGISARKVLTIWRRSRAWSSHDAGCWVGC